MPTPNWSKWEQRVADDFQGRVTPSSGNQWFAKGDVKAQNYIISCKSTDKDSFSFKRSDWKEICDIAYSDSRIPVLAIDMNGVLLAVIDYEELLYMKGKL
jgi:hypothetical protein